MELLVVLAIIALLIAILMPALRRANENAKRVKCMSNHRAMATAVIMYATDWKDVLPFCNWGPNGTWRGQGWAYNGNIRPNLQDNFVPDDVKTGALYPYLRNPDVYQCPFFEVKPYPRTTQAFTSYAMNGATCGYGGHERANPNPRAPGWKLSQMIRKNKEAILFWEIEESIQFAWNDASNFPQASEPLSKRHGSNGSIVSCFDGHAEYIAYKEFEDLYDPGASKYPKGNRLWCNPGHPAGRASP